MATHLTREQILARKTGRGTATLPDGSTVAIRALTQNEVLEMHSLKTPAERNNYAVSLGMTDPAMSLDDVAAWADAGAAGDLVAVTEAIQVLSGLVEGAGKSGPAPA
jgi:hypothetical protein